MEKINKFGLQRDMSAGIRRQVRTNSRNGCVICRALFCDYHHFAPEFSEAKEHNSDGICLLCPDHHAEVSRGRLLNSTISQAYNRIRSNAPAAPPSHAAILTGNLRLELGTSVFDYMPNGSCVLRYGDEEVLTIGHVEDEYLGGMRPSLNGTIRNRGGEPLLTIEDNTFILGTDVYDVEASGQRIVLRDLASRSERFQLELTLLPPDGIRINRLVMAHRDVLLNFDRTFGIIVPTNDYGDYEFSMPESRASGANAMISYDPSGRRQPFTGLRIDETSDGCKGPFGITLGRGAGIFLIKQLKMGPVDGT